MIKTSKGVYGSIAEMWGKDNLEAVEDILKSDMPNVIKVAALELIAMLTLGDKLKKLNVHPTTAAVKTVEAYEAHQAATLN